MGALADLGARTGWFHWSYLLDWLLTAIFGVAVFIPTAVRKAHCKDFDPLDPAISHPFHWEEEFPNWTLPIVAFVCPVVYGVILITYIQCRRPDHLRRATTGHHMHTFVLAVAQALVFSLTLSQCVKQYIGRHRPDFISRLEMELNFDKHAYNISDPGSVAQMMFLVCGSDNNEVEEGMRSFPSGHASWTFAGWTVPALLLFNAIPWRMPGQPVMPKLLLAFTPFILPTIVGGSRTRDNRHNYDDVLAGAVMGVVFGTVAYMGHYKFGSPDPVNRRSGHNASSTVELDDDDEEQPRDVHVSGSRVSSINVGVPPEK